MKKAIKTRYLPPREKQYPASLMDTGLQRWCDDMWFKLVTNKTKKIAVFGSKLSSKNNEWRGVA